MDGLILLLYRSMQVTVALRLCVCYDSYRVQAARDSVQP